MAHLSTWLTKATGVRVPLIQGGMMHLGKAELAAAVANAGALGFMTAFTHTSPESLAAEIKRAQKMTDQPIGVNLTMLPSLRSPDYKAYAQAALDLGVRVFETSGNPAPVLELLKQNKAVVIHKCVNMKQALKAQSLGVDAVAIDGFECAGHPGEDDITSLVLLALCAKQLKIPYIASGGFSDAKSCAAAFAMGAVGVCMGTRWLCTVEAPINDKVKQAIVGAQPTDTEIILRAFKNSSRVYKNYPATESVKRERSIPDVQFKDVQDLVNGKRGSQVFDNGDVEAGIWSMGIVAGVIEDIPTCKDLVARLEREIVEIVTALPGKVVAEKASL